MSGDGAERTPFPEIDTTEGTGYEWFGRFMQAQASIAAQCLFVAFKLGQTGVAGKFDKDFARAMVSDLRTDRADFAFASGEFLKVLDSLIVNIEENLAK